MYLSIADWQWGGGGGWWMILARIIMALVHWYFNGFDKNETLELLNGYTLILYVDYFLIY
jgi:hypothetical protein